MNSFIIAFNMLKRTIQGKKGILTMILLPALLISAIIGLIGHEPSGIKHIDYVNEDQGILGEHLLSQLQTNANYKFTKLDSIDTLKNNVISRNSEAAFVIPAQFSETMLAGEQGNIEMFQIHVNETSITLKLHLDQTIQSLYQMIEMVNNQESNLDQQIIQLERVLQQHSKQLVKAEIIDFDLYVNPVLYVVTGFLLFFMMGSIGSSVSTIMEDRKQKTMARIYSAPIRSYEIALGNFLGSFILGMVQILGVLLLTRYVLGFNYGVSFLYHLIILSFFLLATIGIMSAVGGLVRNTTNIGTINSLIITPTSMIGGCFWPIEIMPEFMQKMANFVPQKWAIDAIQQMAGGAGFQEIWINLAILGVMAIILLGFGSVILKPSENHSA